VSSPNWAGSYRKKQRSRGYSGWIGRGPLSSPPISPALQWSQSRDKRATLPGEPDRGHLTIGQREIVIDLVNASCRAEYEWGVHMAVYAEKAGLT
jgi:hypothetical protein